MATPENATGNGILHTASGPHQLDLRLADSFLSRLRGLMLARPLGAVQGLLITRCPSVHCAFLRYPIDVVYLDRGGIVTQCVPTLRPWRASFSGTGKNADGQRHPKAAHTLELVAGAIEAMAIRPGDRLDHPYFDAAQAPCRPPPARPPHPPHPSQRGSAMIEFTVIGPIITLLGLAVLQYGMLFFAKNQINYASFMAAREGATAHASLDSVYTAYARALVPMYGGGQSPAELAASMAKAVNDIGNNGADHVKIELLNPTRESFADWNDPALQAALHTGGRRVIPNTGQAFKDQAIGSTSGQSIQDANLIKLRITHGYLPKVPFVKNLYEAYLTWLDPHTDAFHTKLLADGRIPVVSHITLHMQSAAIEPDAPLSAPGPGNGGTPTNPGDPPTTSNPPPDCSNIGCGNLAAPPPSPVCNPLTDPAHCMPVTCVPSAEMCCMPSEAPK